MRTTSILLSLALAFKTIYSKAIDNAKIISEQLNVIEEDKSFELVESDNFIYKFHCSEEQEYCDKLKNDLDYAFTTLSNTFEIYQPIVFEVFVDDLIEKYKMNALAAVIDPNYVSLKSSRSRSSTPYLYPQALAKQLRLNKEPKYKKNDFLMVINNCNSFPQSRDNELRSILIHEILHGLGFMSLIPVRQLTDNDEFNIDAPAKPLLFNETDKYAIFPYTLPLYSEKLLEITNEEEYLDQLINTEISKFMPFSVFDKNLVSMKSGEKLFSDIKSYYKEANRNCLPENGSLLLKESTEKSSSDCFESLSSKTRKIITRSIRDNFFETRALGILTNDGDMIPLQTLDGMFLPGSSVSHINNPIYEKVYTEIEEGHPEFLEEIYDLSTGKFTKEAVIEYFDENFILYFSDEDDLTVEDMLELLPNNKKHPLIGDGIIKIMKTLGWTEKGKRESGKRYYLDESIDIPEANSFEYVYKRRYEISDHDTPSTEIEIETTTVYLIEEQPTFQSDGEPTLPIEEYETTLFVNEEEPTFPAEEIETSLLVDEVEVTVPADEEEQTFPVEEVETSVLIDEEEPTFPAEEIETSVLIDEEEPTFPAEEIETSVLIDEEEQTFPAEEIETSVLIDEEEPTFPAEEVETSVLIDEEEPTYPAEEIETSVLIDEEEPTYPAEEVETSVLIDEEEPTFPAEEVETSALIDEEEPTFPAEEDETSVLIDEEEPTFPAEEVETSVLIDEEESTFPAEEVETSVLIDEEESTFPAEEDEATVPIDEEEPTFPAEEDEATVPIDEEEPTFPAEEVETSVIIDEEEQTIPAEEDEATVPVDEEEQTIPAEEVETTVPVDDEIDEEEPILPVDEEKVEEVEPTLPIEVDVEPTLPVEEVEPTLPVDKVELTFKQNPIKYILLKLKELLKLFIH